HLRAHRLRAWQRRRRDRVRPRRLVRGRQGQEAHGGRSAGHEPRALRRGIAMWQVLTGVRILDLSRVFAGPAATQVLGDLVADVIKVEEPKRGDEARYFGATSDKAEQDTGASPPFVALNRNKRGIAIDLATPAGRRAVLRMAKACD